MKLKDQVCSHGACRGPAVSPLTADDSIPMAPGWRKPASGKSEDVTFRRDSEIRSAWSISEGEIAAFLAWNSLTKREFELSNLDRLLLGQIVAD